jgi:hypothetical protein
MQPDHHTLEEKRNVARAAMKAAGKAFQAATDKLAICEAIVPAIAQDVLEARIEWNYCAAVFSEAMANYGNLVNSGTSDSATTRPAD